MAQSNCAALKFAVGLALVTSFGCSVICEKRRQ